MISSAERPFVAVITILAAAATFVDAQAMVNTGASHVVREAVAAPLPPRRKALRTALEPPRSPSASDEPVQKDHEIARGIRKIGLNEYRIQRAALDRVLGAQSEPMGSARVVPEQVAGKVVGIRLYGVRSDTVLGMLGFENGDRLQRINSYDITSPDLALEAYAHLRTANLLLVEVNRRGADTYLLYRIA
jgi:general secretion pathway protein C